MNLTESISLRDEITASENFNETIKVIDNVMKRTYNGFGDTYIYLYEVDCGKDWIYKYLNNENIRDSVREHYLNNGWKNVEIIHSSPTHCIYWKINFTK